MNDDSEQFYMLIGRTIATAGAIEGKIECIIADEYLGRKDTEAKSFFTKEVLEADKMSFGKKIDILFTIMTRRNLEFSAIAKNDLKEKFIRLRNELAHSRIEYALDDTKGEESIAVPMSLYFKIRSDYRTLEQKEAEFEALGAKISAELEKLFFDALWGVETN